SRSHFSSSATPCSASPIRRPRMPAPRIAASQTNPTSKDAFASRRLRPTLHTRRLGEKVYNSRLGGQYRVRASTSKPSPPGILVPDTEFARQPRVRPIAVIHGRCQQNLGAHALLGCLPPRPYVFDACS